MPDLVEKFSLERLNPSPAAINFTKLDHFNGLAYPQPPPGRASPRRVTPYFMQATRSIPAGVGRDPLIPGAPGTRMAPDAAFFFQDEISLTRPSWWQNMSPAEWPRPPASLQPAGRASRDRLKCGGALRALADELGLKAGQLFGLLWWRSPAVPSALRCWRAWRHGSDRAGSHPPGLRHTGRYGWR